MRNGDRSHRTQLFPHLGQRPGFPDLKGCDCLPVHGRDKDSVVLMAESRGEFESKEREM